MNLKALPLLRWPTPAAPRRPRPARPQPRRTRAVRTLAATAVTFVALQFGLGAAAERFLLLKDPPFADKELRLSRLEAAAPPGARRVVMVGTSRTGYGFHGLRVGEAVGTALGRPAAAFNFGIPASGPVGHDLTVRRLLDAGHRPDLLLVEVLPAMMADLPGGPHEQVFSPGTHLRRSEVDVVVGYGFPPDKTLAEWRQTVVHPWYALRFPLAGRAIPSWLPWGLRQDWGRTVDAAGWCTPLETEVSAATRDEKFAHTRDEYGPLLRTMTPGGGPGRALAHLLATARDHGVPVKLVLMPESTAFRGLYAPAVSEALDRFLTGVCRDGGCEWIDARTWLPDEAFTDGHHMLRPGAEAFSDRLTRDVIVPFFQKR